ncbi:MAG TPA: hypothetical protein DCL55_16310, partial [Brevundimonas sp.]|nr:hypothetical protein [Brevundimonas sp.]
ALRWVATAGHERTDGHTPVRVPDAGAADRPLDLEASAASLRLDMPVGDALVSGRVSAFEEMRGSGVE